jgi:hypothetical protein
MAKRLKRPKSCCCFFLLHRIVTLVFLLLLIPPIILALSPRNGVVPNVHRSFLERYTRYSSPSASSYNPQFPIDIVVALPIEEGNVGRNPYLLTIGKAQPVFDVAIGDIYDKKQLLKKGALRIAYEDTELSDSIGPQKVVDRFVYCLPGK